MYSFDGKKQKQATSNPISYGSLVGIMSARLHLSELYFYFLNNEQIWPGSGQPVSYCRDFIETVLNETVRWNRK